jgi:hypothetical protein
MFCSVAWFLTYFLLFIYPSIRRNEVVLSNAVILTTKLIKRLFSLEVHQPDIEFSINLYRRR